MMLLYFRKIEETTFRDKYLFVKKKKKYLLS